MSDPLSQTKMDLAEALTDASRGLDRIRRRVETVITILERFPKSEDTQPHIDRCKLGIVQLQQLNNDIRKMNT